MKIRSWLVWILMTLTLSMGCSPDEEPTNSTDPSEVSDATDAGDVTDATDTSDPSETQVVADPVPLTFELCTETNPGEGACECATQPGFQTYRAVQGDVERCFTVYGNPGWGSEARPLIIEPDCYSENRAPRGALNNDRYGFRSLHLTAPDGGWEFPLNGVVNSENAWSQCDPTYSREINYLATAFTLVDQLTSEGLVAEGKVFMSGFSQNSMFSLFAATCFPDRLDGISQGGSGLFSAADGSVGLPQCEGVCAKPSFETYGSECISQEPCGEECAFWPVYPTNDGDAIKSCLFMYDNDNAAHSTAAPAHKYLSQEGHQPSLYIFGSDRESNLGGHTMPVLGWEWINHCLGIFETCSSACATEVVSRVESFKDMYSTANPGQDALYDEGARQQLMGTYMGAKSQVADCSFSCVATQAMLDSVQAPSCTCGPNDLSCTCQTSTVEEVPGPCMP